MKEDFVEYKGKKIKWGRYKFNQCLPSDYPIIDEKIDNKRLKSILNDIVLKYPESVVAKVLDSIKDLGFESSTIQGYTLSVMDLHSEELEKISKSLIGDVEFDMQKMNGDETIKILKDLPFSDYITSGSRGSWDQVKQLVLSRGYVSDSSGRIRQKLIRNSLVTGLTQDEFFDSSWGARKGLLDIATSTGDSGYLTRQLIYSTVNIELGDVEDCGTKDYLSISIPLGSRGERIMKTLMWRYYAEQDGSLGMIGKNNYKKFSQNGYKTRDGRYGDLVNGEIKLRSPIFCESKKICKRCYGELYKILHSDQIGIIATQAIGERITQLVLRTFHTGGVAQVNQKLDKNTEKGVNKFNEQSDIISGINFANSIFHKPETLGEIKTPEDHVNLIYKTFNPYREILMVHYELITSAMMMSNNKCWRLIKDRNDVEFNWVSILKIPGNVSWLLGAAFSNLKTKLLDGVVRNRWDDSTAISKLFKL